jgi:hypothetical protein
MTHDYFLSSKRIHQLTIGVIMVIAAFLRWYRLDNCTLASGDEWLAIGPTFQFLEKFFRNPITAVGYELAAGFPFADIGRMGPPFDYTRSLVLVWTMPYYAIVGLFDFPVSEGWYRFPGTIWSLLALGATYYFVYQLTQRRVAALFALAMQATLLGHLVQSRFLVADGVFLFWYTLAAGLWIQFLRTSKPRIRHFAYLCTMFYTSSTPEAPIGLASLFTLVVFWLWQEDHIDPFRKPLDTLAELKRIFLVPPLLWLVGFYIFEVMVELKFYIHDRENFLNHASYLGRFFGRGGGAMGFFPDRVIHWYLYPHISAALIVAGLLSLLLIWQKKWRAALSFGWLWVIFWVLLTLFISNSSSNFTRIMPAALVLGAAGLTAIYDRYPLGSGAFGAGLVALNIWQVFAYPLLCPLPENQNVAQSVGYLVQAFGDEWGGRDAIAFYFPTGSLYAYIPEDDYVRSPSFLGEYTFEGCEEQRIDPASMQEIKVVFALPPDYDNRQQLNNLLDYAVEWDCEAMRNQALDRYVRENGYHLAGQIVSDNGQVHANIWAQLELDLGQVDIEETNRLHVEMYSRKSWFSP